MPSGFYSVVCFERPIVVCIVGPPMDHQVDHNTLLSVLSPRWCNLHIFYIKMEKALSLRTVHLNISSYSTLIVVTFSFSCCSIKASFPNVMEKNSLIAIKHIML